MAGQRHGVARQGSARGRIPELWAVLAVIASVAVVAGVFVARPPSASTAGWTVTGMGDSVTAGTACDCADFVQDYARLTRDRTGRRVLARNLGVPGQTSADLVTLVHQPDVARQLADSNLVLVTTGANDLADDLSGWQQGACSLACFDQEKPTVTADVTAVVDQIRRLRRG